MATSILLLLFVGFSPCSTAPNTTTLSRFEFDRIEMAVPIRIVLYAHDEHSAKEGSSAAFQRIHQLNDVMSDYDGKSEVRRLCDASNPENPAKVSGDLFYILREAQKLSKRTDGAFDVTVGPVVKLWRRARRRKRLPSEERLAEAKKLVSYQMIHLNADKQTVSLEKPKMRIDLGGIAKGYAIDEALAVLRKHGITRALIDAGGDISLGDPPLGKEGWSIAIARLQADSPPSQVIQLSNKAIATSGDRWQYVEIDGRRYSHLIDPHTGIGLTDHSSVTIIAPNCTLADSLASAVSVLGPKAGIALIEKTPGTAALILRAPNNKLEAHYSFRWDKVVRQSKKPPRSK